MSLDTKVKNLIINTNMTKEQYEAIDDKSNQLFFVEDSSVVDVPAPEENQSGYLHTDGANLTWKEIESGDKLPDQTDNAGKFLMTDGENASWSDKPLVNNADNESSTPYKKLSIGGNSNLSTATWYTAVGHGAYVSKDGGIAIGGSGRETGQYAAHAEGVLSISMGYNSESAGSFSIAIGDYTIANGSKSIAIGSNAEATATNAIAIGGYSGGKARAQATAECAIQLGCGTDPSQDCTNSDANTLKVANNNGNFEMMDANGKVPLDRLTYVTDQIGDISTVLDSINGETLEG